jgi:inorganic pyrophosphatase
MWLFTNNAFVSVVADRENPQTGDLLVRARAKGHINSLWPDAKVFSVANSDYAYRAWVSRNDFKEALLNQVDNLNYTNFKNSIRDKGYHDAALDVWDAMYSYQSRQNLSNQRLPRF